MLICKCGKVSDWFSIAPLCSLWFRTSVGNVIVKKKQSGVSRGTGYWSDILEYTWTTLQDKSLNLEQIDKVCDLHFVYMGYSKFGHITHASTEESVKPPKYNPQYAAQ